MLIILILFLDIYTDSVSGLLSFKSFKVYYYIYKKLGILSNYTYVILNICDFKAINSVYGVVKSNSLLKQIGYEIKNNLYKHELACRVAGDKYILLLQNKDIDKRLQLFIEEIKKVNSENFLDINVKKYNIIDNSISCLDCDRYAHLAQKNIDVNIEEFDIEMYKGYLKSQNLIKDFMHGIENNEFECYFQGKYLVNKLFDSAEVLVRWNHPILGVIPPIFFIELLEQKNKISLLDKYIVKDVCSKLIEYPKLNVSINLSSKSFCNPYIIDEIIDIINKSGVNPFQIEFELTETSFIDNRDIIKDSIIKIHNAGMKIALDDFGTGFSSLALLKDFDIDTLKIDRSFINNQDIRAAEIVKSIILLAHKLKMTVVAEGVENKEQLEKLKEENCDIIQGYLFAKPEKIEQFLKLNREFLF